VQQVWLVKFNKVDTRGAKAPPPLVYFLFSQSSWGFSMMSIPSDFHSSFGMG